MKQNLANSLAVGGVWALYMGWRAAEVGQQIQAAGYPLPIGDGSVPEVFTICSVRAFQDFCNAVVIENGGMQVVVRPIRPGATLHNRYGQSIDREEWARLKADNEYTQVAMWHNDIDYVSTVWTGVDPNGCTPPHIFETVVVRRGEGGTPRLIGHARYTTNHEALVNHHRIVAMVKMGRV